MHGNCPNFRSAKLLQLAPVPGGREMYIRVGAFFNILSFVKNPQKS